MRVRAALAFAILAPAAAEDWWADQNHDPKLIGEAYVAELFPAIKGLDQPKLMELYAPECVFGNPDAGAKGEQKEVLEIGFKNTGFGPGSQEFRDELKALKVVSAVVEQVGDWETSVTGYKHPIRVTALVKFEYGHEAFYQWIVLVPFEGAGNGWTAISVLAASPPASATELVDLNVGGAVGMPSVALAATFASGVLLSGLVFSRKEISARLAPQGPLLS